MKATTKSGKEINLGNIKSEKAYNLLNEENFEKLQEGNLMTNEGNYFEDYKVNNTVFRKIYQSWLTSGKIINLNISL